MRVMHGASALQLCVTCHGNRKSSPSFLALDRRGYKAGCIVEMQHAGTAARIDGLDARLAHMQCSL